MNMFKRIDLVACALALCLAVPAAADETRAEVRDDLGIAVGTRIDLVPASSFKASGGGMSNTEDGKFGAGFGVLSDYRIIEYFKAGLEFMYYTVKSEDAKDRGSVVGFGPRLTGTYPFYEVGPFDAVSPYAFLTMGYSHYGPGGENATSRNGFWYQFGAGAEARLGDFGIFAEIAYEGSAMEEKQRIDMSYAAFGMGFGAKYHF